jgi:Cdc6-like AAA superfamily ATPase
VSSKAGGDLSEARDLARRALELLLAKYVGALTEEERRQALKGLEHLFPEEELEGLEEESRLR